MDARGIILRIAFIIVISIILIAVFIYGIKPSIPTVTKSSGNIVIDTITLYQDWTTGSIPYVFQPATTSGQLNVSYYDGAGYETGVDTFVMSYTMPTVNSIVLNLVSTTKNFSGISPGTPWTLTYTSPTTMSLKTATATINLSQS